MTCLIFPLPLLFAIPNAALKSANILFFMANPHSDANWVMPIISQLILIIATSSASPELKVTFLLGGGRGLEGVSSPQDGPTARAPGCLPAACPVGVGVAGSLSAGVLELEAPDASGAPDEVAPKNSQSTEVTSGVVAHLPCTSP